MGKITQIQSTDKPKPFGELKIGDLIYIANPTEPGLIEPAPIVNIQGYPKIKDCIMISFNRPGKEFIAAKEILPVANIVVRKDRYFVITAQAKPLPICTSFKMLKEWMDKTS